MPIKSGLLKGELTTAEIRKLIKAHNVLMSIKIPAGATRSQILKILDDKGYMVNHVRQSIQRRYKNERKPNVTLKQAEKITAPKKKTELQKKKMQEAKEAKEEMKKKEAREIRKKAVEEEKMRAAKKAPKPTAKKVSVGVGTEKKDDKKDEKPVDKQERIEKEKEIKKLWQRVLIPDLRTAYESGFKTNMKKAFTKAVGILAKYESKRDGVSDATARKRIKAIGGSGRLITKWGERATINKAIYEGVDITDILNT